MIDFKVCSNIFDYKSEVFCILLEQDFSINSSSLKFIKENYFQNLEELFKAHNFSGKCGQNLVLVYQNLNEVKKLVFVGTGKKEDDFCENLDNYRNSLGIAFDKIQSLNCASFALDISYYFNLNENLSNFLKDSVITLILSSYQFDEFKQKNESSKSVKVKEIGLCLGADLNDCQTAISHGQIIGESINNSRRLSDLPPNIANPDYIAEQTEKRAKELGLECNIFDAKKIKELSMGGVLAVSSGSKNEPKFIELKYSGGSSDETVVLVGKGVTFDTGGVSLKPARYMTGMKYDMSGAATVLGAVQAIAKMKPNVNVVALAPLVENMPSGSSYRQDDIITHMNGITTEVDNTDAEGRLILADALVYAEENYKPSAIIDVATLTGACVVALGHFYTGMVSTDQALANDLIKIGEQTGDYLWQLPSKKLYGKAIESSVADVSNCGKSNFGAGAITAAMFLKKFVKTKR